MSNPLYPKLLLSVAVLVASLTIVNVTAQLPAFEFEELEILPDPNRPPVPDRDGNMIGTYNFIFNFCDNTFAVEDPRFMIVSDIEKRPMQLTGVFHKDTCYGAVEKIRAMDPDSITAEMISFGNSNQIDAFEEKIAKQQAEVDRLRQELQNTMNQNFDHHQDDIDATNAAADKLWQANRELQHLTDQYYNMMHQYHPEE